MSSGATGELEALGAWAGQGVGLVTRVQPAAEIVRELAEEIVRELAEEAESVLRHCAGLVGMEDKVS